MKVRETSPAMAWFFLIFLNNEMKRWKVRDELQHRRTDTKMWPHTWTQPLSVTHRHLVGWIRRRFFCNTWEISHPSSLLLWAITLHCLFIHVSSLPPNQRDLIHLPCITALLIITLLFLMHLSLYPLLAPALQKYDYKLALLTLVGTVWWSFLRESFFCAILAPFSSVGRCVRGDVLCTVRGWVWAFMCVWECMRGGKCIASVLNIKTPFWVFLCTPWPWENVSLDL